jgi:hypothetical protein
VTDVFYQCFAELKEDKNCTEYMFDFLTLIESKMIIVEAKDNPNRGREARGDAKRIRTEKLKEALDDLYTRCLKNPGYALDPQPKKINARAWTGVEVELNTKAEKVIRSKGVEFDTYSGEPRQFEQQDD